jgi:hypothetical protein
MSFLDLFQRKKRADRERTELDREIDDSYEVHEDSDLPVTEKLTREKKIKKIK